MFSPNNFSCRILAFEFAVNGLLAAFVGGVVAQAMGVAIFHVLVYFGGTRASAAGGLPLCQVGRHGLAGLWRRLLDDWACALRATNVVFGQILGLAAASLDVPP